MDVIEANAKLQGRCKQSRKLQRNTYLQRRGGDAIAIKLHGTDVLTFHANGRIRVNTGGWSTPTTRDRINNYLPKPWHVFSERGSTILSSFCNWADEKPADGVQVVLGNSATILPDGTVDGGGDVAKYREDRKRQRNEARRPANRARYWLRKARGLFADKSGCHFAPVNGCRWNCGLAGRWSRRQNFVLAAGETEKILKCGCRVYRKTTASARLTVEKIMAEENQTVRSAMLSIYGVERFFLDAKPEVVDTHGDEYQLLSLNFGNWNRVRALKMICPSTKVAYIATVPPQTDKVSEALDFMFDTDGYLDRIAQAS